MSTQTLSAVHSACAARSGSCPLDHAPRGPSCSGGTWGPVCTWPARGHRPAGHTPQPRAGAGPHLENQQCPVGARPTLGIRMVRTTGLSATMQPEGRQAAPQKQQDRWLNSVQLGSPLTLGPMGSKKVVRAILYMDVK